MQDDILKMLMSSSENSVEKNSINEEVVTEGKKLDTLKKMGIVAGMSLLGGGVGVARHNTHSPNTGTRIVDGSAIPAGVAGAGGGGLIGSLMAGQMVASSKRNRDLKKHLKANKQKRDGMKNEEYTQVLEQMIISLTGMELEELHEAVGNHLSEDYQTPARNAQMQDMYDRAEGKFMNNLSSDKLLRKVWAIDNKSQKEMRSPRLYGKNGKIIKQTKKKRVRVGQPGGRQGGYQGGNQIGNGRGGYQGGNQIGNV